MTTRFFNATTFTPFALQDAAWGNFDFVNPSGIPSAEAFGANTVRVGRIVSAAGNIASAQAFGVPLIPGLIKQIFTIGIASAEAFGSAQAILLKPLPLWRVVQLVSPLTDATSVFFGATGGPPSTGDWFEYDALSADGFSVTVNPDGTYFIAGSNNLDPSDNFHGRWYSAIDRVWSGLVTITLVSSPYTMGVTTIPSKEAFGSAVMTAQAAPIRPNGIVSAQAFGIPTTVLQGVLRPAGIVSLEAFGTTLVLGPARALPAGITSGEAFGFLALLRIIQAGVIVSGEVFGSPTMTNFTDKLVPVAIPSEEFFGFPSLITNRAMVVEGIESGELFGNTLIFSPGVWSEEEPLGSEHWIEELVQ